MPRTQQKISQDHMWMWLWCRREAMAQPLLQRHSQGTLRITRPLGRTGRSRSLSLCFGSLFLDPEVSAVLGVWSSMPPRFQSHIYKPVVISQLLSLTWIFLSDPPKDHPPPPLASCIRLLLAPLSHSIKDTNTQKPGMHWTMVLLSSRRGFQLGNTLSFCRDWTLLTNSLTTSQPFY